MALFWRRYWTLLRPHSAPANAQRQSQRRVGSGDTVSWREALGLTAFIPTYRLRPVASCTSQGMCLA